MIPAQSRLAIAARAPYLPPVFTEGNPMARTNPVQFISQVRAEVGKVVWPTRREVALTSVMVFLLAIVAALFFSLVDLVIRFGLTSTLNFFGS